MFGGLDFELFGMLVGLAALARHDFKSAATSKQLVPAAKKVQRTDAHLEHSPDSQPEPEQRHCMNSE